MKVTLGGRRDSIPVAPGGDADGRLIERSRSGDAKAFAELVGQHQGRVRAFIGSAVRRPDVVDDLAQEVFLAAFRSLEGFRGEAPFGTWLLGIARNHVLMFLRDQVRRLAREASSLDAMMAGWRLGGAASEGQALAFREREIEALQRCLERLPAPSADLVAEHYYKARSLVEIAREMGKKEGALRMMLLRVRQSLRDCVQRRLAEAA